MTERPRQPLQYQFRRIIGDHELPNEFVQRGRARGSRGVSRPMKAVVGRNSQLPTKPLSR